jgi:chromate transport protein ChrA
MGFCTTNLCQSLLSNEQAKLGLSIILLFFVLLPTLLIIMAVITGFVLVMYVSKNRNQKRQRIQKKASVKSLYSSDRSCEKL